MPETPYDPTKTIRPYDKVYAANRYDKPSVVSYPNALAADVRDEVRMCVQRSAHEREKEAMQNSASKGVIEVDEKAKRDMERGFSKILLREVEKAKKIISLLEKMLAAKQHNQAPGLDELQRELFSILGNVEEVESWRQITIANRRAKEAIYRGLRSAAILCNTQFLKSSSFADLKRFEKKLQAAPRQTYELTKTDIQELSRIFKGLEQYVPQI